MTIRLFSIAVLFVSALTAGCASESAQPTPNTSENTVATETPAIPAKTAATSPTTVKTATDTEGGAPATETATPTDTVKPDDAATPVVTEKPSAPTTPEKHATKTQAPISVQLVTSGISGKVQATLKWTATADIPDATARFKVPTGLQLVSGKTEIPLGALKSGQSGQAEVSVRIPKGKAYTLAGGVDCHVSKGVKLHKGATVKLGASSAKKPKTTVIKGKSGSGIRVQKLQ